MSRPSRQKSWRSGRERVSVLAALAIQKESVSRKLAQLRITHADPQTGKALSQEKAAARVHVTMRQWQRWESGESIPYPRNLEAIAAEFGFEVAEFFDDPAGDGQTPDPFRQSVSNDTDARLADLEAQVAVNTALLEVIAKHLGIARVNEQVEEALAQPPRRIPESLRETLRTAADRLRAQETQGTQGSSRQAG